MAEHKQAVVVGALGVIGRYIHIAVDLVDGEDTAAKLAGLRDATHVFYAAFQPAAGAAAGYASNIAPNRAMLVSAVTAIDRASPALRRVVLVTGTKYYGSHLGAFRAPGRGGGPPPTRPQHFFSPIDG